MTQEAEPTTEAPPRAEIDTTPGANAIIPSDDEVAAAKEAGAYTEGYGIHPKCPECGEFTEPSLLSQHINAHMGRGAGAPGGAGLPDDA